MQNLVVLVLTQLVIRMRQYPIIIQNAVIGPYTLSPPLTAAWERTYVRVGVGTEWYACIRLCPINHTCAIAQPPYNRPTHPYTRLHNLTRCWLPLPACRSTPAEFNHVPISQQPSSIPVCSAARLLCRRSHRPRLDIVFCFNAAYGYGMYIRLFETRASRVAERLRLSYTHCMLIQRKISHLTTDYNVTPPCKRFFAI